MPLRVLIVDDYIEDRHKLIFKLPDMLRHKRYDVLTTPRSSETYDLVWKYRPHLIVLDVWFPRQELQGVEIVRGIRLQEEREGAGRTPIILISEAKTATAETVAGLEAGADDYAAHKDNDEIVARVLRHLPPEVYEPDDDLAVHLAKREVRVKRGVSWQKVHLGRYEFDLLEILIKEAGRPIRKIALQIALKPGDDEYMSESQLFKTVSILRARIEPDPANPRYILIEPDFGYKFNDGLSRTDSARPPTDFPAPPEEPGPDVLMLTGLLGLPHVQVIGCQITGLERIEVRARSRLAEAACPACGQTTAQTLDPDGPLMVRDLPIWGRRCWLSYRPQRFACPACSSTFVEPMPWSETDSAYTARYLEYISERIRHEDTSWIACSEGLSQETVQRIAERSAVTDRPG
jgi:DNA-binding response OmpR family regulator